MGASLWPPRPPALAPASLRVRELSGKGERWHGPSQAPSSGPPSAWRPTCPPRPWVPFLAVGWDHLFSVPHTGGTNCLCLQLPKTQAELCTLGASTPLRPPSAPAGLISCPSPLPGAWSMFRVGRQRGPSLTHTVLARGGRAVPCSPPSPPWAGPGQGINRSGRWALPTLPVSPTSLLSTSSLSVW